MPDGADTTDWPLVGREEELELLRRIRAARPARSAVITGPPGVGKTRLARAASTEAHREGWATLTIQASASLEAVPLGPLRAVLSIPAIATQAELTDAVRRELLATSTERGLLLVVNDAQSLDELSVGLLHQLVAAGSLACVVTARSGPLPAELTDLWKDGFAQRIELQNLSLTESYDLLGAALGGAVQDSTARRLWQVAGGNPLYLKEMVLSGVETGALREVNGEWRWRGRWTTGSRLHELVAARIGRLDPDASSALEFVALATSLPLALLVGISSARAVQDLEERELVRVEHHGGRLEVAIAHPLHAEVLRDQTPALRQRAMWRTLVDALSATPRQRGADLVRMAWWSHAAGLTVDPVTLALGTDASLFAVGHAISRRLGEIFPDNAGLRPTGDAPVVSQDDLIAVRLAEIAFETSGDPADGVALAEALAWTGQVDRAEAVLSGVGDRAGSPDNRLRVAVALAWIRFWGRFDVAEAESVLLDALAVDGEAPDRHLRAEAYEQLAGLAINTARPALALAYAERGAAVEEVPLAQSASAPPAAAALVYLGRCADAIALVDEALPHAHERGHTLSVAMLLVARVGALSREGRLDEARQLVQWLRDVSLAEDLLNATAVFGAVLGEVLLRQGQTTSAGRFFRDSAGLLAERDVLGYRPWALTGLARARAAGGEDREALALLAEARRTQKVSRHFDGSHWVARVEVHQLAGRAPDAIAAARDGVAWAHDAGMVVDEAFITEAWLRVDPSPELAERLVDLATRTDSELVRTIADHASALVARDAGNLVVAGERFAALGAWRCAAEAAGAAAEAYGATNRPQAAKHAAQQTVAYAAQCEGQQSALVAGLVEQGRLTAREREVVTLAAAGRSSQEIADTLFVSRRTVESHLQHAYAKLGVTNRAALARVLRTLPSP
ncbi:MAG: LuxR C-terminal-related transcriptional regulator [Acidimicrobiales bacterium]